MSLKPELVSQRGSPIPHWTDIASARLRPTEARRQRAGAVLHCQDPLDLLRRL